MSDVQNDIMTRACPRCGSVRLARDVDPDCAYCMSCFNTCYVGPEPDNSRPPRRRRSDVGRSPRKVPDPLRGVAAFRDKRKKVVHV